MLDQEEEADQLESCPETLRDQLTNQFYLWEKRGRGWQVWEDPVELEPPFCPFKFHHISPSPGSYIDNGRKPTFLSSLVDKIWNSFSNTPSPAYSDHEPVKLEPDIFSDNTPLSEIQISLPRDLKIIKEAFEKFLLSLSYCSLPLGFEIIGLHDSTNLQIVCRKLEADLVTRQIKAYFPEISINGTADFLESHWDTERGGVIVDFGLSQEFMRPLNIFDNFDIDPLIALTGALDSLDKGEVGILQVLFQAVKEPWAESIMRSVTNWQGRSFFVGSPEMLSLAKEKVEHPLFATVIRIGAQSEEIDRAWKIAKDMGGALSQFSRPHSNELIPLLSNDQYDYFTHQEDLLLRETHRSGMILNSLELVSLAHFPSVSVRSEKLRREMKKTKAAPVISSGHQMILGENIHQGAKTQVTLSHEQRLRHVHVIGATGTGKTSLILNMITQDICGDSKAGVAVLDPHGDLIDQILGFIPESKFDDVILLDPSDTEYPIGFNILQARSDLEKNVLASDLVAVFKRLSTSWGDQMTAVFGNAVLAILESEEGGTLLELRKFLVESDYRKSFLEKIKDQEVRYYWQKEFPLLIGKPQGSILTRLDTFLRPKIIRNMVSQKEGLNFDGIINEGKIFLAKLSQGLIGEENAYLLGTLIVSKIQQAAMARQTKNITERKNFYLYIDEFQNFLTPSMGALLSGARKYHLGLILAHQDMRQLWNQDTEVANSVISNAGARICFRLGDFDAQKLKEGFSSFGAEDLQNLGIGEAICRIERAEYDFNLKTFPLSAIDASVAEQRRERLVSLSRDKYSLPQKDSGEELLKEEVSRVIQPSVKKVSVRPRETRQELDESVKKVVPITVSKKTREKLEGTKEPVLLGRGGQQHKYLQQLIKSWGEDKGYLATIEKQILDGQGSIDVALEKDGKSMACEISITSTGEQELANIQKCLKAGFDHVIMVSPEKKNLHKIKEIASANLCPDDQQKVLFFTPDEFFSFIEEQAASPEETVRGYKVKVQFRVVDEKEKSAKKQVITQTVLAAMKRLKISDK